MMTEKPARNIIVIVERTTTNRARVPVSAVFGLEEACQIALQEADRGGYYQIDGDEERVVCIDGLDVRRKLKPPSFGADEFAEASEEGSRR